MNRLTSSIRHFFTPTENNNFRARAIHHDFLTFYLTIALLFILVVKTSGGTLSNVLGYATDISIPKLYQLTNVERDKAGLKDLSYNETLSQAAFKKAQDMFAKNYWAHYAPGGKTPWDFMYAAGYQYEYAGENLAKNFTFSDNVIDGWMKSPSHRENILKKEYTQIGFAVVNGVLNGEETTLVVQMLGKPLENGLVIDTQTTESKPDVIVADVKAEKSQVNASRWSFNIFWSFMAFLLVVLGADLYFAARMQLNRFHGINLSHMIFIIFVTAGVVLFLTKGVIL